MSTMMLMISLVIEIACGVMMHSITQKRGVNETVWFMVGLILGPFALIFIPFIKKQSD
ncbi:MAG: hypothetical protein H0W64_11680 [Gammaproteobacteria bacterium]|nr:hypothetical protein [Gammaproteobacteria bacterium]